MDSMLAGMAGNGYYAGAMPLCQTLSRRNSMQGMERAADNLYLIIRFRGKAGYMNTKKSGTKRRAVCIGGLAAFVGVAVAGCGGGGSGSFVDQNGRQVVGQGEPSDDLRRAVAYIITDPAQEVQATEEELGPLRTLAPLLRDGAAPSGTGPEYDAALGLYVVQSRNGTGRTSQLFEDASRSQAAGQASGTANKPFGDYISSYVTSARITSGALRGTSGGATLNQRANQTYSFTFLYELTRDLRSVTRTSETLPMLKIRLRGEAEKDAAGRVEYNVFTDRTESRRGSTNRITGDSRVIRRRDRSGERRGTYTFNGDVLTVRVSYGPGGIGTGTVTGNANGFPARIAVGERITSVTYADDKTIDTFDGLQPGEINGK